MADRLPLLLFPRARTIPPPRGRPFTPGALHFPNRARQVERLSGQLTELQDNFARYRASISGALANFEPETVLVIEIAGSVDDFRQAVESIDGLEWQGEWDVEDIEPDQDFYKPPEIGVNFFKQYLSEVTEKAQSKAIRELLQEQGFIDDSGVLVVDDFSNLQLPVNLETLRRDIVQAIETAKQKSISGKLFVSLGDQRGLEGLLALWRCWQNNEDLPYGKTKWRDIFAQTLRIRRWGIEETLHETGMPERWHDLLDPVSPAQQIHCQIELFYRRSSAKRKENEAAITALLQDIDGATLSPFIDIEEIAFHAVKVTLPAAIVRELLDSLDAKGNEVDIQLFKFPGVMYFRPTGQSIVTSGDETGPEMEFPSGLADSPPLAAILDGVPNLQHDALRDRLSLDDPDNLSALYQPGQRKHGTAMASLVVHGELAKDQDNSLTSQVYFLPVMQPNPLARNYEEYFPDDVFFEDRIERAVRRMIEGEGDTPPQAPTVKIINLSIGDPDRPFIHIPSPWAKLLDWLAWKYRLLFCVSVGNCADAIDVGMPNSAFAALSDEQKVECTLNNIERQLSHRRLLSPAESLNALTIGATHTDESGDYTPGRRIDLLPNGKLFSPISRFGHGFRRSVKPEILFPGGRQLYQIPPLDSDQRFSVDQGLRVPGQHVAWDSAEEGALSNTVFGRGTSNATALATRAAVKICDVLGNLNKDHDGDIPDELMAVLVKTLLVHGAHHDEDVKETLATTLKNKNNSRRFKEVTARYIGYGAVNVERVLACTEQRATVLGSGEIRENEVHEYRFPLPAGLSGRGDWRRMVVTLAWFTPINPGHRNLREAKLAIQPALNWGEVPLRLAREDSDHNQVSRGTVQHEVLEGGQEIEAYEDDGHILLHVTCKPDATESLDQAIPYGLAVTLEVAEGVDVPIYEQIRARIQPQIAIGAGPENT